MGSGILRGRILLALRADPGLLRAMGHNTGKDNVKKRKARRIKSERLQAAKDAAKATS